MKQDFARAGNILIIRLSSLGDILLSLPVITALKKIFPRKNFSFVSNSQFGDAVNYHPFVEKYFAYDRENPVDVLHLLEKENFDFIIDLQNNRRSAFIRKKLNLPFTVFRKPDFKKFLLVNFKVDLFKEIKQIPLLYAESISDGLEVSHADNNFYLPEGKAEWNHVPGKICLCPGAQHYTKRYPPEYVSEFSRKLLASGFSVTLIGGKDDRKICSEIAGKTNGVKDASNNNDLFALAREMQTCSVAVCNDSGLMHLAAAIGLPVIAIFGSSVRQFGFAPFSDKSLLLENNSLSCRPCSHVGKSKCPKKHFKCMKEITPDYLYKQFTEFYEKHV